MGFRIVRSSITLSVLRTRRGEFFCAFLENGGLSPRIGADFSGIDYGGYGLYQARMAPFAEKYKKNEDAEDGVRLYRSVLAAAEILSSSATVRKMR